MEKRSQKHERFGAKGELLVVIQMALVALYLFIPDWPVLRQEKLWQHLTMLRWIALLFGMAAGAILGIGGSIGIRKYLTPLPYPVKHNQLVDKGVYSLVRHPLYSAQLVAAVGWSFFSLSLTHLFVTIAAALFFNFKASKEEAWLAECHPEYREYARRVGKFIPGLGRKKN